MPSIFVSYCHADISCARQIEADLGVLQMDIVRDERQLRLSDDLPSYMKRIRKTDFALLLVSDAFLKSVACMNEVLEFIKDDDYRLRILPVILPDYSVEGSERKGARIYDPVEVAGYVRHWEDRLRLAKRSAEGLDIAHAAELAMEIRLTQHICAVIGEFIATLRNTVHVKYPDLVATGYRSLLERLGIGMLTAHDARRAGSLFGQAMAQKTSEGRLRYLEKALALHPKYPEALNKRGQVLDELKRYEEALESYNQAIEAAPSRAAAYISRSYAWIRLGRTDAALADLDKAIELEPDRKEAFNNRADVLRRLSRFRESVEDARRALAFDPEFDLAYATLAEIAAAQGDAGLFFEELEKAVRFGFPLHKYAFDDVYRRFESDDRFVVLCRRSQLDNDRFI